MSSIYIDEPRATYFLNCVLERGSGWKENKKRLQNGVEGAWALSVETLLKNKFVMLSDSAEGQDLSAWF